MTLVQVVVMALVQGLTELFPVSSVAHNVILPSLLHWHIDQAGPAFLPFVVVLHLGTALALLVYFWRDWIDLVKALFGRAPDHRRLLWIVILATIPAVVLGYLFEKKLQLLFAAPEVAAVFLIVNGALLFWGDRLASSHGRGAENLTAGQALWVGLTQCLAFIPGFSRSGTSMIAAMGLKVKQGDAARLSFLLGFPVILGAGVLEVPKLHSAHVAHHTMMLAFVGGAVAAVVAYVSVAFLMRYFGHRQSHALRPFSYYCGAAGVLSLILLALGI